MATNYSQVSYGSKGSDVKTLQELLNQNGYSLDTDGVFGSKTQAAVKDYQKKSGLSVDGIVGKNTWGALAGTQSGAGSSSQGGAAASEATPAADMQFSYDGYQPSDTVQQAYALLQQQMGNKPGAYQSQYQDQIGALIDQITNREKFSYDLNADALYQQYADQHMQQGKMAMMDTMGQAQAMTGGYGNSYAQSVGQQAYQGYLQKLNEVVPELYGMAYDQYQQEGQDMLNQYALLAGQDEQEYGRHQDAVSEYYAQLQQAYDQYNTERDYDYSKWADGRDFAYGQFGDDRAYAYQQERDKVSDSQWKEEFDEAKRQYDQQYALAAGKASGGSGNSGNSSSDTGNTEGTGGSGFDNQGYDSSTVKQAQAFVGVSADGKWGKDSAAAAKEKGYNSLADVLRAMGRDQGETPVASGFTGSTYSEAAAYIKANGGSASGLMTGQEWARHKSSYDMSGQGGAESKNYNSYLEYLKDYVEYATGGK